MNQTVEDTKRSKIKTLKTIYISFGKLTNFRKFGIKRLFLDIYTQGFVIATVTQLLLYTSLVTARGYLVGVCDFKSEWEKL